MDCGRRAGKERGLVRLGFACLVFFLLSNPALAAQEPVQVVVEGLEGEALKNVQAALALPPGLVRDGTVDRRWLDRFQEQIPNRVREALEPFGYYQARVQVAAETTAEGFHRFKVRVDSGEAVIIREVHVSAQGPGREEPALRELLSAFPLRSGDVLRQDRYETAKGELRAKAHELGYLDAEFSGHEILVSREERSARLRLVLDTGPQYRFGEVGFEGGAPPFPEAFLRRYLAFQPGEVFSQAKIGQTQLNFSNSDRFQEVLVVAHKEGAQDLRVPVEVKLLPSPPKRLRLGIGYGTDTGARLSVRYQDVNFARLGHEWNADLNLSERIQGLATRYVLPGGGLNTYTSFKLALQQDLISTYSSRTAVLESERARGFGAGRIGSVYLQLRLEDFNIADEDGYSRLILPGLRFSGRFFNDLVRPTRGHRYSLETRGTHQALGSDTGFVQQLLEGDLVRPLPGRFLLLARFQAGFTAQNQPLREIPPSIRFFAGGDRSVRGYRYQSLGPEDSSGKVVGGRHLLVGSLELEKVIYTNWGLAAFYDVGNAFNTLSDLRLFQGAGIGVRYYTRLGPIRLDLARQIGIDDPSFRLHFTVGFGL